MTNHTTPGAAESAAASHPSVERLADLAEQLSAPAEQAELRAHLAGCPECADTLAALAEVSALLAGVPVEPMPADVALRIDAALARAAAEPTAAEHPAAAPAATDPSAAEHPATEHPATEPTATEPAAPPAAGPANVAAGSGRPGSTAPPARADRSTGPAARTRARRRGLLVVVATAVAGLGLGSAALFGLLDGQQQAGGRSGAARPADAQQLVAGPHFTADGLPDQIHQLLGSPPATGVRPHATTEQGEASPAVPLPPPCVRAAVDGNRDQAPLTVAHGSYAGAPADAYVYRVATDPGRLDVYLLAPGCTQAPATVLLHQQIAAG
ncbi:anti-sigma factor family protein [Kitasatospora sp. NPDC058965]|uniref:anti-sigma factor family protein n=1 Tax=Kitasatospora sp. NPDC058965 TaxID=3346682 RepID=UPI003679CDBB